MVKIKVDNGHTMTVKNAEYHRIVDTFYKDRDLVHEQGLLKLHLPAKVVHSFLKNGV